MTTVNYTVGNDSLLGLTVRQALAKLREAAEEAERGSYGALGGAVWLDDGSMIEIGHRRDESGASICGSYEAIRKAPGDFGALHTVRTYSLS